MGEQWRGGDVVRYPGGGQKVNLLRPVLEQWKNQHSTVIMFVDRWEGLACVAYVHGYIVCGYCSDQCTADLFLSHHL